jgi:sigma-E factor negative regulatory protein RseC
MFKSVQPKTIFQKGVVQQTENQSVFVAINCQTACSGCHAGSHCTLGGNEQRIIEVSGAYNVKKGDEVTVHIKQAAGYSAVLLAYIIPLAVVLTSLTVLSLLKISELTAGLLSILMLIPYFTLLFLFRKHLNDRFIFKINDLI